MALRLTPLEQETRAVLPTNEAAPHINRQAQTMRVWACTGTGPIKPVRINGRLGWATDDLRRLVGVKFEGGAQ